MTEFNQKAGKAISASPSNLQSAQKSAQFDYDLERSRLLLQENGKEKIAPPKINTEQANQIILELNRQFEQKVLKKIKTNQEDKPLAEAPQPDFQAALSVIQEGRPLSDYLETIRTHDERPNRPFLDADSHKDLSQLKTQLLNSH